VHSTAHHEAMGVFLMPTTPPTAPLLTRPNRVQNPVHIYLRRSPTLRGMPKDAQSTKQYDEHNMAPSPGCDGMKQCDVPSFGVQGRVTVVLLGFGEGRTVVTLDEVTVDCTRHCGIAVTLGCWSCGSKHMLVSSSLCALEGVCLPLRSHQ
jgi:hypothetical protein